LGYYDAVYKWIEENGHQIAGSPREVYMTRPMDKEVGIDQLFLEIAWPYK
jgi:effector-binding domain-containing protein